MMRVNRGPELGRNVRLFNNKKIAMIMYSKWIMVSALMITNLFTLYLQDLNPRMHVITACTCIWCLQNLIVNFKDHDCDVLTD